MSAAVALAAGVGLVIVRDGGDSSPDDAKAPAARAASTPSTFAAITDPPRPAPSLPERAVAYSARDRLVVLRTDTGEALRTLYQGPSAPGDLELEPGVALSPDGRTVWFSPPGDCTSSIKRVSIDGGPVEDVVARGSAPSPSPDGRWLAFARGRQPSTSVWESCANSLVLRDLVTGEERVWTPAANGFDELAAIGRISWAPDSRRLAFDQQYEGGSISVLDIARGGALDVSTPIDAKDPDDIDSLTAPSWLPGRDRVLGVASCCYVEPSARPHRLVEVDVGTGTVSDVLDLDQRIVSLAVDGTGQQRIYTTGDDQLWMLAGDVPVLLGRGFVSADW